VQILSPALPDRIAIEPPGWLRIVEGVHLRRGVEAEREHDERRWIRFQWDLSSHLSRWYMEVWKRFAEIHGWSTINYGEGADRRCCGVQPVSDRDQSRLTAAHDGENWGSSAKDEAPPGDVTTVLRSSGKVKAPSERE
jgi:hypothetical protein